MGLIILSIVSIILLVIAGLFFWVEMDDSTIRSSDGTGGCIALVIFLVVVGIWTVVGIFGAIASFFT